MLASFDETVQDLALPHYGMNDVAFLYAAVLDNAVLYIAFAGNCCA